MSAKTEKILDFLEEVADPENPSIEERDQAWNLLYEALRQRNVYLREKNEEIGKAVNNLRAVRRRLEHINQQIQMAQKSNIVSTTIH